YCLTGAIGTYNSLEPRSETPTFGGYSTHIVVTEDFVLRVPKTLDPAGAAPLLCAGITTYSPLTHVGVSKGDRVGVIGLGGLGHMAVKLARSFGAEVSVFSRSDGKRGDALRLGAHEYIVTSGDRPYSAHRDRFDCIIDTVSASHDIDRPLSCLRRDGTM